MSDKKIKEAVVASMDAIKEVDEQLMADVVGVAHSLSDLRKALDKVDECLNTREFEKAASLGYADVSSGFIFLQRTLGALTSAEHSKESLISDIALKSGSNYEEVEPYINEKLDALKPPPENKMSKEEIEKHLKFMKDKFKK